MRKILDCLFSNLKLAIAVPSSISVLLYFLFLIFGDKKTYFAYIYQAPLFALAVFAAVYVILMFLIKVVNVADWYLNLFEFMAIAVFGIATIMFSIDSIIFNSFSPMDSAVPLVFSAVALAHRKRK